MKAQEERYAFLGVKAEEKEGQEIRRRARRMVKKMCSFP